jgi:hypothetical protein
VLDLVSTAAFEFAGSRLRGPPCLGARLRVCALPPRIWAEFPHRPRAGFDAGLLGSLAYSASWHPWHGCGIRCFRSSSGGLQVSGTLGHFGPSRFRWGPILLDVGDRAAGVGAAGVGRTVVPAVSVHHASVGSCRCFVAHRPSLSALSISAVLGCMLTSARPSAPQRTVWASSALCLSCLQSAFRSSARCSLCWCRYRHSVGGDFEGRYLGVVGGLARSSAHCSSGRSWFWGHYGHFDCVGAAFRRVSRCHASGGRYWLSRRGCQTSGRAVVAFGRLGAFGPSSSALLVSGLPRIPPNTQ